MNRNKSKAEDRPSTAQKNRASSEGANAAGKTSHYPDSMDL
jgi:hypothetical protein